MPVEQRPARDYDIRFGHGLVKADSARWPRYVAATTPSAWAAVRPFLAREPAGLVHNKWLDRKHLEETTASLPDDVELAVGIGAGRALDHAKFVADRKGIPLIQVPTVVSTGAIIHGFCGQWTGRVISGVACIVNCEYVLVDYDLVLKAPERLNTAGLGDVLCGYAGLSEWRHNAKRGYGPPFDPEATRDVIAHHAEIVDRFPKTLGRHGELTDESVRFIMKAVQDRDERMLRHPAAPGADHQFCFSLELANDRFWIHGEECALGAVIVAWHTEQSPETLIGWLDTCRVKFRPRDMDISKPQLQKGLQELPRWMGDKAAGRDVDSLMRRDPVTGKRFEELWAWLSEV
ncbi:MAG: iron-containing alcohol dehydrogenase [Chloroflexi bacterium]|nr:iron-containing alcohol dehydrogenase [Chloroflexota bacterium]